MKRNNYLFIASMLLAISCSPSSQNQEKSLAELWQKDHLKDESSLIRSLASTSSNAGKNSCLENFFNVETLKKEVQEKESQFKLSTSEGSWKHLNYSQLPLPQANFLMKYGKSIGDLRNPESIDYSSCTNLVCIFNKIYGKDENYIAGYVHYLWYLKFRNYLSADNFVDGQNSPSPGIYRQLEHPFASYLYSEEELYGFWRLTHLLNEPFTTLSEFKEIQRLPRGQKLEGMDDNTAACGNASGNSYIRLGDGCLKFNSANKEEGFFYIGALHEIAHLLDYDAAKKNRLGPAYAVSGHNSERAEYSNFIGFTKQFQTLPDGSQSYAWYLDPSIKVVRDYARTSPVEHFADTIAYFRFDGDHTEKEIDPKVYNWVKDNYFHGNTFSKKKQRELVLNKYIDKKNADLLFAVLECEGSKGNTGSYYLNSTHFPKQKISYQKLSCLSEKAERLKDKISAEVSLYELEGCHNTKESEYLVGGWYSQLREGLTSRILLYTNFLLQTPSLTAHINTLKSILTSASIANTAFLECYKDSFQNNVSQCYQEKIEMRLSSRLSEIQVSQEFVQQFRSLYVEAYPYSDVVEKLLLAYQSILDTHQEKIKIQAEDLWNTCKSIQHDDKEEHIGTTFIAKGYLVSSFANCINANIKESIQKTLEEINYEGTYIRYASEELIFKELITPRFLSELESLHKEATEEENKGLSEQFLQVSSPIKEQLLSDLSWLPSLENLKNVVVKCRNESLKKIDFLPLYHIKRDVFSKDIEIGICIELIKDQRFQEHYKKTKEETQTVIYSQINLLLEKYAKEKALKCIDKIPGSSGVAKKLAKLPRKACLSYNWSDVTEQTIQDLSKAPEMSKFKISVDSLASEINSREENIKKMIEDEYF